MGGAFCFSLADATHASDPTRRYHEYRRDLLKTELTPDNVEFLLRKLTPMWFADCAEHQDLVGPVGKPAPSEIWNKFFQFYMNGSQNRAALHAAADRIYAHPKVPGAGNVNFFRNQIRHAWENFLRKENAHRRDAMIKYCKKHG